MARLGQYEEALKFATRIKEVVDKADPKIGENRMLLAIFLGEYKKIMNELNSLIEEEKKKGLDSSMEGRKDRRTDNAAQILYAYKDSKSAACNVM